MGQGYRKGLGSCLARAASWFGLGSFLAAGLVAQNPPTNLTVTSGTPPPYYAYSTITTSGTFNVVSGSTVLFQAPGPIKLEPGFRAYTDSNFDAKPAPLPPAVTQTIATSPVTGIQLTEDGAACSSPCTGSWVPGYSHTVAAPATYTVSGTSNRFRAGRTAARPRTRSRRLPRGRRIGRISSRQRSPQ